MRTLYSPDGPPLLHEATEHRTCDDGPCGWEGETVVQVLGPRRAPVAQWTCPRCGAEHEDDVARAYLGEEA